MEFNLVDEFHGFLAVDHIEGKTFFAKAPGAANPVEVRLVISVSISANRQVEVDHDGHLLHINTWGAGTFQSISLTF